MQKTIQSAVKTVTNFKGESLKATAALVQFEGQLPYFSVTGEQRNKRGRVEACGCLHTDILKEIPAFEPLIALHLSDVNGVPMHAEANGYYWLAGAVGGLGEQYHGGSGSSAKNVEECLEILASHLRVNLDEARSVAYGIKDSTAPKEFFAAYVEAQKPRWAAEAKAGLELIAKLNAQ